VAAGVAGTTATLIRERRPLFFFGTLGFLFLAAGGYFGVVSTLLYYQRSGIVSVGSAILTALCILLGTLSLFTGVVLDYMRRLVGRRPV
jgi:hypothetical protein